MRRNQKSGFTLLEIIVVLIILSVVLALALPRFFGMVETSRGSEALNALSTIRGSMERCYLAVSGDYTNCFLHSSGGTDNLDIDDPDTAPNTHFTYVVSGQGVAGYTVVATRNSRDGGNTADTITYTISNTGAGTITKVGTGAFKGIH